MPKRSRQRRDVETEIKLRIEQLAAVRRRLRRLGFLPLGPRMLERNFVFDSHDFSLRKSGRLLRLRLKGREWWLTFKDRPKAGAKYKIRREIETKVEDGERLVEILERLGYFPVFQYEKYRTEFQQPGRKGKIMLDETPLGNFIELEGPASWIDRIASSLGYRPEDYILASYGSLYLAWCAKRGLPPGNMTFPADARPRKPPKSRDRRSSPDARQG